MGSGPGLCGALAPVGCRIRQSCSAEGPRLGPHVLLLPRLLWSPPSWLCHLFLPRLFSFQSWSLPGILSLLSCVLTRRPALLPAARMAGPRLLSSGHGGSFLGGAGARPRGPAGAFTLRCSGSHRMGAARTAHPKVGAQCPCGLAPGYWGCGWEPVSLPLGLSCRGRASRRLHVSSSVSCRCSAEAAPEQRGGHPGGRGGACPLPPRAPP